MLKGNWTEKQCETFWSIRIQISISLSPTECLMIMKFIGGGKQVLFTIDTLFNLSLFNFVSVFLFLL